jgi:Terminase RNaseH-like domain
MNFAGLDCSGKGKDFTCLTICEKVDKIIKVKKVWRDRNLDLNIRIECIKELIEVYKCEFIAVESNSMGIFYVEELSKNFNIKSVATTRKSKPRMIDLIRFYLERERLDLREVSNTVLIEELRSFTVNNTHSSHDDTVMSLAIALYAL